jgi:CRISPR-associated protein Cas1
LNPLHLSGYGVKIKVGGLRSKSELEVTDGRDWDKTPSTSRYRPRRFPYSSVIVDGHSGYVSLQAFHWLSRNKVPVFILNFDGSMISSILPPGPVKADLRAAQIKASEDSKMKFSVARSLVQAKVARNLQVLDWLAQRYDIERAVRLTRQEALPLSRARNVVDLRTVEGRVALRYWQAYASVIPECFNFHGRMTTSHQNNASDPVNLALNYAYGVLEGECRAAINTVGLEPSVGFLHETSGYQTKQSLVYDLQEPFRWIADVAVMDAFESGVLDLPDFYFTGNDYRYRFEPEAKQRLLDLLRERFNSGVRYQGRALKWDTVIEQKTVELGRYLIGRTVGLDFSEPSPNLQRVDDSELRRRILDLSQSEANKFGIGKSTFHNLRENVRDSRPFKVYKPVVSALNRLSVTEVALGPKSYECAYRRNHGQS